MKRWRERRLPDAFPLSSPTISSVAAPRRVLPPTVTPARLPGIPGARRLTSPRVTRRFRPHRRPHPMHPYRARAFVIGTVLAAAFVLGCKPDYPSCETDKDCSDKKEFCVAGKCQQCRETKDCPEGTACNSGRCDKIPNFCTTSAQCPNGLPCIGNRCAPCAADKDCPRGTKCWKGTCDNKKHCVKEDDCAQNEDCTNGVCTSEKAKAAPPPQCTLGSVYFDFNEAALTTEASATLTKNADCLKQVSRPITVVGHTDPRGTAEYN